MYVLCCIILLCTVCFYLCMDCVSFRIFHLFCPSCYSMLFSHLFFYFLMEHPIFWTLCTRLLPPWPGRFFQVSGRRPSCRGLFPDMLPWEAPFALICTFYMNRWLLCVHRCTFRWMFIVIVHCSPCRIYFHARCDSCILELVAIYVKSMIYCICCTQIHKKKSDYEHIFFSNPHVCKSMKYEVTMKSWSVFSHVYNISAHNLCCFCIVMGNSLETCFSVVCFYCSFKCP